MASAYLLIARIAEDRYAFDVPSWLRDAVLALADQLDDELDGDDHPVFQRLFPTAYPDDPEKDAGYQILARGELIETRHSAIDTVRASADAEELDGESLDAWMRVVNDLRLVLGTHMDLSEDHRWKPRKGDESYYAMYEAFSLLLQSIVEAQMDFDDEDLVPGDDKEE
ncbi:MAG: DUF2017 family protein [Acidimicrobiales bacterium]|nr:DUF2017 family protein [Acidimicrobiales bacterium]